jgi:hypothetical protein
MCIIIKMDTFTMMMHRVNSQTHNETTAGEIRLTPFNTNRRGDKSVHASSRITLIKGVLQTHPNGRTHPESVMGKPILPERNTPSVTAGL